MGVSSVLAGAIACTVLAWDRHGKFVALGLGLFAMALGLVAAQRARVRVGVTDPANVADQRLRSRTRLLGAGGVTLGAVAALLGGAKIALTLAFLSRLGDLLGS